VLGEEQEEEQREEERAEVLGSRVEQDKEVWRRLEDPACSPGLEYQWRDSSTYNLVLSTLGMDSRVLLDGPGWLGSVRQAATLLTPGLLTPVPVAKESSPDPEVSTSSSTGAPGPARGGRGEEQSRSRDEHGRRREEVGRRSAPGKEASSILRSFPLLDFMASSLLVRRASQS